MDEEPEKQEWPSWSEMDGTGKFVTIVFWFLVLQVINAIFF